MLRCVVPNRAAMNELVLYCKTIYCIMQHCVEIDWIVRLGVGCVVSYCVVMYCLVSGCVGLR